MFKRKELIAFAQDRLAITLLAVFVLSLLALVAMVAWSVRPSDVQVPVRYSGYGVTNIYRDKWFALLGFGLFAVLMGGVNAYLALKVHGARRGLSVGILGMSVVISIIALVVSGAILHLAAAVL